MSDTVKIFADSEFYEESYLLGREPLIPLAEFSFWARKASNRINWRKIELLQIPQELALCACAVAEAYYRDEQTRMLGAKSSESVGAYSVSYADQKQEPPELRAEIDGIVGDWLSGTPLHNDFIFRGR